jgi:hypothetical protein
MRAFFAVAAVSALLAGCAGTTAGSSTTSAIGPQAKIPFVNYGSIRDFDAVDDETVYLQANNRQWYRADLMGRCIGLEFANGIGVDARPSGTLDRFSTLIVDGQRCKISSLSPSESPRDRS